jgi:uncharacterized DUF497 family protein
MRFEWDPEKELINIKKHGIDFTTALNVFNDPNITLIKDRIDDETGEQRWHAIGAAAIDDDAALLAVVHVYRGQNEEEIIRIISAREASKRERRLYIQ